MYSSVKNELNGMGGIIASTFSGKVCVRYHCKEIGPCRLHGCGWFQARDADQIANKWDGLIKDYKKLKDYIEGTCSANWLGINWEEKK